MEQNILNIEELIAIHPQLSHYQNDLICFERTSHDFPFPYQPIQLNPYFSVTLFKQGNIEMRLNGEEVRIEGESLLMHDMNYQVEILSQSKDVRIQTLYISNSLTKDLPSLHEIISNICLEIRENRHYLYRLNNFNYELIEQHLQTIVNLMGSSHTYIHTRLQSQISALWLDLGHIIRRSHEQPHIKQPRHVQLFRQFYNLVVSHCRQHHHIEFYADTLHVTRQYLSHIVKEQTHRSPGDYISDMLVIEARKLLMNHNYSITQIADKLYFEDVSCFCKFFKRYTGITPSEYRTSVTKR